MRLSALGALLVGIATASHGQTRPAPDHPIIGTWTFSGGEGSCTDTYTFRSDGTRLFSSADETGESEFAISAARSERGYYRLVDTITRTNGKPDCIGTISPVGDSVTLYVRFQNNEEFMTCRDESAAQCFGPFKRMNNDAR